MADLLSAARRHRLAIFAAAMAVIVAWALWTARGALPAFFVGLALALILDPGVTRLQRLGVPRWAGILASYAAVAALVWLLIAYAVPPIARQTDDFLEQLPQLGSALGGIQDAMNAWYQGLPLPTDLRETVDRQLAASQQAVGEVLRGLLAPTIAALLGVATFVLGLVVVPVWVFFVLKDREGFGHAVAGALPPAWRVDTENLLALLARLGGRWVRGQLLLGASVFAATAIGLTILTLLGFREFGEFTLVLALIAGVLEWFPIIGPIVSAIPAILIGITIGPPAAIAAALLYTGIQQLENNLLVPKVLGDAIELHPAVMIVALVVGGALFGIGGAILAAPTVAAGRDLYRYGFHRLSGLEPAPALELAFHGRRAVAAAPEEAPSAAQAATPKAEAATADPGSPAPMDSRD